jgi:ADP-dependent NAD(P)H-hydrate dehydratase / NAD(P)H-hydrate epimerase
VPAVGAFSIGAMKALPDWCEPLFDAQQMRAIDRWAIDERGVASLELMERAGTGVAAQVERVAPDGLVTVVCGKGNNGGDGLVVARLLRSRARDVEVICTCDPAELTGDAHANLERLPGAMPLRLTDGIDAGVLDRSTVTVDAVLGTGFQGVAHGEAAEAIEAMRRERSPVLSVDVPSGVDASSGAVEGPAVHAMLTVALHAAKPGLWIAPGKQHAGELRTLDIGIPRGAPAAIQAACGLIEPSVLGLLPSRGALSTKFSSGHVVVAGGSRGLMGAPAMAALAAMRTGAGYVTACVPRSQTQIIDIQLLEVMTRPMADEDGSLLERGAMEALAGLSSADALVLGPGLGRSPGAFAFARELALSAPVPTLIDADGLNAHAGELERLRSREAPTVLTPHAGELARLLEVDASEVQRRRLHHARLASERSGAVVVLKGDDTLVARSDGCVAVSPGGAPALATAGSGDVLSGVIGALLAQGVDAFAAASVGVLVHLRAACEATRRVGGPDGVIASDVIGSLPASREAPVSSWPSTRASALGALPTSSGKEDDQ